MVVLFYDAWKQQRRLNQIIVLRAKIAELEKTQST